MISFQDATDAELMVMREAVDALTTAQPALIHEDDAWCEIVHGVTNEIAARTMVR